MARVWGVEPVEERALDQLEVRELSLRKHDLLTLARTAEAAHKFARLMHPSLTPDPERIHHREDPCWRDQWTQVRDAAWHRRREHVEPIWCVVANVVRERPHGPGGVEVRWGTKHFRGGSRVHVIDAHFGACMHVVVIGRQRRSRKWTCVTMPAARLERFRAKLAYDPAVIDGCLTSLRRLGMDQALAESSVDSFSSWAAEAGARRETLRAGRALLPARFAPEFPHLDPLQVHAVNVRLRDGTTRLEVPMSGPYFNAAIDFDRVARISTATRSNDAARWRSASASAPGASSRFRRDEGVSECAARLRDRAGQRSATRVRATARALAR